MDFLEYKQISEALKYIEDYNPSEITDDKGLEKALDKFQIKDIFIGKGSNNWNIPYSYGNGCTKNQINLFKGILLSVFYTIEKNKEKLKAEKTQLEKDIKNGTYKGKTLNDYENLRLETIYKIKNTEGVVEKLNTILEYSKKISEGTKKIAEYEIIKDILTKESAKETKASAASANLPAGFSIDFIGAPVTWEEALLLLEDVLESKKDKIEIYSSKPLTPDLFLNSPQVTIDIKYEPEAYKEAEKAFRILAEALFPSGFSTVLNRGRILLYSNKAANPDEIIRYDSEHNIYKNGLNIY